jgi:murein DD-endopeptidase MepM/ murein hydrolase activator NlpD
VVKKQCFEAEGMIKVHNSQAIRVLSLILAISLAFPGTVFAEENHSDTDIAVVQENTETDASEIEMPPVETDAPVVNEPPEESKAPEETGEISESEAPAASETENGSTTESEMTPSESATETVTDTGEIAGEIAETETETDKETVLETAAIEIDEPEEPEEYIEVPSYMTETEFAEVSNRMKYSTSVPIEGLPSFITQEMVAGALNAQDLYGYPASVTIAQIIMEAGFGSYGTGGSTNEGLTRLAYESCNLFEMKGTGTAGSVELSEDEIKHLGAAVPSGILYKVYRTYSESIEDRSELLQKSYSDILTGISDADEFAIYLASRWSTEKDYGLNLLSVMQTYDLYRLDELTLDAFSDLLGTFANPCPGSHISSTYGYREFDHKKHLGLDLATHSQNIPTYAAEAGVVTYVGYGPSTGNMIVIDHGNGMITKYMHHSEMYVTVGQKVIKGQQIGLTGTTGHSTGIHLHFQVEVNGATIDPLIYLKETGSGETIKMRNDVPDAFRNITSEEIAGIGQSFSHVFSEETGVIAMILGANN